MSLIPFEPPSLDSLISAARAGRDLYRRAQPYVDRIGQWRRQRNLDRSHSESGTRWNRDRAEFMAQRRRRTGVKRKTHRNFYKAGKKRKLLRGHYATGKARLGKFNRKTIKRRRKTRGCNFELVTSGTQKNASNRRYPVLVGHASCGPMRMFLIGIRGLVKLIAQRLNMDFKTWDEYVGVTRVGVDTTGPQASVSFSIYYQYQTSTSGDLLTNKYDILTRVSWDAVALGLANQLKDLMNNDSITDIFSLDKIWVQTQSQSTTTSQSIKDEPTCIMAAKDIFLELDCYSKMVIQNRTAAVAVGLDDVTNRNDISANPLVGKAYHMNGGVCALARIDAKTGGGSGSAVRATDRTGVIYDAPDAFATENGRQYFAIPSHKAFKNCKSSSNVTLLPGVIKSSVVRYHKKCRLNTFLVKMRPSIRVSPDGTSLKDSASLFPEHPLAKGCFFLLKKSLHDGSADDPFPLVAWQVNQKTNVVATYKRNIYITNYKEEA